MQTKESPPEYNFDPQVMAKSDPPVLSWYKPGQTYTTVFEALGSSFEECRAECVGIYLCLTRDILKIFGYNDEESAKRILYVNWLAMVRAGLLSLEYYNPKLNKHTQAHMQARFAILQVLLEAGKGLVEIKRIGNDDLLIQLNESLIETVGKQAIGEFLRKIQVYKATADKEAADKMYKKYSEVNQEFLSMRDIVLQKKKPRKIYVQSHLKLSSDQKDVELEEFEASPAGLIKSYVTRFGVTNDTFPEF